MSTHDPINIAEMHAAEREERCRERVEELTAQAMIGQGDYWNGDFDDEIARCVQAVLPCEAWTPNALLVHLKRNINKWATEIAEWELI